MWDSSYVSTGVYDENVNKTLGESKRAGDNDNSADLGNGEVSYGYAVKGVEFTYLRVGDIVQYTESANDGDADNHIEILYGIDKAVGADLLPQAAREIIMLPVITALIILATVFFLILILLS